MKMLKDDIKRIAPLYQKGQILIFKNEQFAGNYEVEFWVLVLEEVSRDYTYRCLVLRHSGAPRSVGKLVVFHPNNTTYDVYPGT